MHRVEFGCSVPSALRNAVTAQCRCCGARQGWPVAPLALAGQSAGLSYVPPEDMGRMCGADSGVEPGPAGRTARVRNFRVLAAVSFSGRPMGHRPEG